VLALGDSNTYGVGLDENQAYPAQLEAIWNSELAVDSDAPPRIEVMNLGYPGTNSSRILANLKPMLERLRPDIVFVMVGANDAWTPAETVTVDSTETLSSRLRQWSRVYRLYYMLRREAFNRSQVQSFERDVNYSDVTNEELKPIIDKLYPPETRAADMLNAVAPDLQYGDARFVMAPGAGEAAGWIGINETLPRNLLAIRDVARAAGTRIIFLTYPANTEFYRTTNEKLREMAATGDIEIIDVGATFLEDCPQTFVECGELFFYDGHPRAPGYERMARVLASALRDVINPL
jgi:lysophospholipase L1-like esterase